MPNLTTNYKFKKPIKAIENADIDVLNENSDSLDTILFNKVNNSDYGKLNVYISSTSGSSTAYIGSILNGQKSYVDGQQFTIIPHVECGDSPTLNINGIGALKILKSNGEEVKKGNIKSGKPLSLVRVGSSFFIRSSGYSSGSELESDKFVFNSYPKKINSKYTGTLYDFFTDSENGHFYAWSDEDKKYYEFDENGNLIYSYGSENTLAGRSDYGGYITKKRASSDFVETNGTKAANRKYYISSSDGYAEIAYLSSNGNLYLTTNKGKIFKYDKNGNLAWTNNVFYGPRYDAICEDSENNTYIGGWSPSGNENIIKINKNGVKVWGNRVSDIKIMLIDNENKILKCWDTKNYPFILDFECNTPKEKYYISSFLDNDSNLKVNSNGVISSYYSSAVYILIPNHNVLINFPLPDPNNSSKALVNKYGVIALAYNIIEFYKTPTILIK